MNKNSYFQITSLVLTLTLGACSSGKPEERLAAKRNRLAQERAAAETEAKLADEQRSNAEAAQRMVREESIPREFTEINYDARHEAFEKAWSSHYVATAEDQFFDIRAVRTGVYNSDTIISDGFGYYIYLLIVDESRNESDRRKAASYAFVCDLSKQNLFKSNDTSDFPIRRVALFLAPVLKKEVINMWHLGNNSPSEFLDVYDYKSASFLNNLVGSRFKSIGIVGLKKPIFPHNSDNVKSNSTIYFDLSKSTPKEIEHVILTLREIFNTTSDYDELSKTSTEVLNSPFHLKLADFFSSVGRFVARINPIASVNADESNDIRECSK